MKNIHSIFATLSLLSILWSGWIIKSRMEATLVVLSLGVINAFHVFKLLEQKNFVVFHVREVVPLVVRIIPGHALDTWEARFIARVDIDVHGITDGDR